MAWSPVTQSHASVDRSNTADESVIYYWWDTHLPISMTSQRFRWVGGWREWRVLVTVAVLALPLFTPRIYASDEIKYFATLRSVYFDRDLHYANEYAHFIERDPVAQAGLRPFLEHVTPTGRRLNDAPIGSALLWAPFYVAADGLVLTMRSLGSSIPRDGYSRPYVWGVCLASLFWGIAGLFLCYRLCREYVSRTAAAWGVVAVWFASPVVFYLYITPAMSHANSLFAVALFVWLWHTTRVGRTTTEWVLLGAAAALMVLVRELNWLFLFLVAFDELRAVLSSRDPLTDEVTAWRALEKFSHRAFGYAAFAATVTLLVAPQFYVYRTLNGTFGPTPFVVEKFSVFPVHAFQVLFSGFHGLFSWHPVTLAGVLGLTALWRRAPTVALAFVFVLAAQVVVIGSYDTWWGGASFGARRFINCTILFAVGAAAAFAQLRGAGRHLGAVGVVLLILWNFGLAVQYSVGLIPRDAPVRISRIAYNQLFEVPPRVAQIAWRFAFDRSSLYRTRS